MATVYFVVTVPRCDAGQVDASQVDCPLGAAPKLSEEQNEVSNA